jgi:hypothetical protein
MRADAYAPTTFDHVVVLEFYMPLTQESALRRTLDSLFYEDAIVPRLERIDAGRLRAAFGGADDASAIERAARFIDAKFRGYSIYRVDGRFRAMPLATVSDAAEISKRGTYLADETTAVCRFVFPCNDDEPAKVRLLFDELFVAAITERIKGEEEIWVVESGMRNQIRIWRPSNPQSPISNP